MNSIKTRLLKLEQKAEPQGFCVITIRYGADPQAALQAWLSETGKPKPPLVIFIVKFSCD